MQCQRLAHLDAARQRPGSHRNRENNCAQHAGGRVIAGIADATERKQWKKELLELQREDGGWRLVDLGRGEWKRKDDDVAQLPSDAYATGFTVFILRRGGVPAQDKRLRNGLAWLRANQPKETMPPVLSWGDARIGNMLFQQGHCAAVLDWEMARLGDARMDLAWGLFLERYHTEGNNVERLPGFKNREETLALYEEMAGVAVENIGWFEVLAGMRFSVILARLAQQLMDQDFLPKDTDFEWNNPVSNLHGKQLEELGIV